ncbi:hypothetical protein [Nostoc sp. NMS4]|uniref:hypothetical protein n=1 Tax=Nostoc sp. NMS4 TaxID=2815390 RepID=UPI0025DB1C25|nr:hypothetical protein [Nostoc sp. NMS4]MBN3921755.1 hypothetical protein [Nostoc sp. NMS4]
MTKKIFASKQEEENQQAPEFEDLIVPELEDLLDSQASAVVGGIVIGSRHSSLVHGVSVNLWP